MMWWSIIAILAAVGVGFAALELRFRRPDQLVLYDAHGEVRARTGRFYPRHLSLCLPYRVQTIVTEVEAEAKGRLGLRVQVTATAGPDPKNLAQLVRVGGWSREAVERACKELELVMHSLVRSYTEQKALEEIRTDEMMQWLRSGLEQEAPKLGLEIVSASVQSIEPRDREIAEVIQQREAARIRKQTEIVNQQARVAAMQAKLEADERIARSEHELQLVKLALRKEEELREAELARFRLEQDLEQRRAQLALDQQEIELLARNPEVLLLTPQLARLAEASQGLRNARTIVSLSPNSLPEDSPLAKNVVRLLERLLSRAAASGGQESQQT
ncbi:MAG: SPFH domain-containing protein [candidate division KSB1 bacterium]|nr:SPFH domain-containing protein [candidate division KSB1 bacterium]